MLGSRHHQQEQQKSATLNLRQSPKPRPALNKPTSAYLSSRTRLQREEAKTNGHANGNGDNKSKPYLSRTTSVGKLVSSFEQNGLVCDSNGNSRYFFGLEPVNNNNNERNNNDDKGIPVLNGVSSKPPKPPPLSAKPVLRHTVRE